MTDAVVGPQVEQDAGGPLPTELDGGHPAVLAQIRRATQQYGPDFDPTPLHVTLLLYRMISISDRAHSIELGPLGINGGQFNVLTVLHRSPGPLTMKALARAVSVRPANLTTVVNSLRDLDYLVIEANPADRRSSLVRISQKGRALIGDFMPGHWQFLDAIFRGLDRSEREHLIRLLTKLVLAAGGDDGGHGPGVSDEIAEAARHSWRLGPREPGPVGRVRGRRPSSRPAG